ncbi:MAG: type II toxin-antitoxin system RelE/ParE family toxin [Variibacter sp.]
MKQLEWSAVALADLDRFARFLMQQDPRLAALIAEELIRGAEVLESHPRMGRAIAGHENYREAILKVMNGRYIFQYRVEETRTVMLRVLYGREDR